jgi:N-acetylneuraminic acid mutarotase
MLDLDKMFWTQV